jgi:DNA-binding beta-propeller fold protein YncE
MYESVFCNSNLLTQVSSLVFDDDGILYASNYGNPNGSIIKIDKNGNGTLLTNLGNQNIACIAYYNNYLYVSIL